MGDISEYYADKFYGDDDYDGEVDIVCKFCGEAGLHWDYSGVRWRLRDDEDKVHVCPRTADPDDFDDLTK